MKTLLHHRDDTLTVQHVQDVEPILEQTKRERIAGPKHVPGLGYKVGTIPDVVVMEYMKHTGISYHEFCSNTDHVKAILNNPDFKHLRVWEGRF